MAQSKPEKAETGEKKQRTRAANRKVTNTSYKHSRY